MKSLKNKADVAQRKRIAQRQLSTDFLDNALEWRRIFAEAWGTFLLVVVAAGGEVVAPRSGGAVPPGMKAVAPGLMVMAPFPPKIRALSAPKCEGKDTIQ